MSVGKLNFSMLEYEGFTIVHFQLENSITPNVLKEVVPPKVDPKRGVVLGGRAPVWLYCYLVHYYHPTKFVAVYDPRLGGAVVVESHTPEFVVGDVIEVRL